MMTPLDEAFAAMQANPDDTVARLAWYDRLAASEVFLLLDQEVDGQRVSPKVFPVDGAQLVLVFDREERLSEFTGDTAAYVALSGRVLAGMLAAEDLGIAVNVGTEFEMVIEPDAVRWLATTLQNEPEMVEDRPVELLAPGDLPEALLEALDMRLATAQGRARAAYLVGTRGASGQQGHLLAFIDPAPGAEGALAQLVSEALTFSGLEAAALDVAFFRSDDPIYDRLSRAGLRFDLPDPIAPQPQSAPGSDPSRPPRLR